MACRIDIISNSPRHPEPAKRGEGSQVTQRSFAVYAAQDDANLHDQRYISQITGKIMGRRPMLFRKYRFTNARICSCS